MDKDEEKEQKQKRAEKFGGVKTTNEVLLGTDNQKIIEERKRRFAVKPATATTDLISNEDEATIKKRLEKFSGEGAP